MAANTLVVCFGARRVVVKTTPMMTLQAVLVNACEQSRLPDPSAFALWDGKKPVDASLSVRFSGLRAGHALDAVPLRAAATEGAAPPPQPTLAAAPPQPAAAPPSAAALGGQSAAASDVAMHASEPLPAEPAPQLPQTYAAAGAAPTTADAAAAASGAATAAASDADAASQRLFGRPGVRVLSAAALHAAAAPSAPPTDLPDDFYDYTSEDYAASMASARAAAAERPLMTAAMRARAEAERVAAAGPVRIRLTFPDGLLIEAQFPAGDPVQRLLDLAARIRRRRRPRRGAAVTPGRTRSRRRLRHAWRAPRSTCSRRRPSSGWHAARPPPARVREASVPPWRGTTVRTQADPSQTLYAAGLAPAARVYVGVGTAWPKGKPLLRAEVAATATLGDAALLAGAGSSAAAAGGASGSGSAAAQPHATNGGSGAEARGAGDGAGPSELRRKMAGGQAPKWLKIGK